MRLAVFGILAPFGANSAGWIFTEMGRQPFVVAPNPELNGIDQRLHVHRRRGFARRLSLAELIFSLSALR